MGLKLSDFVMGDLEQGSKDDLLIRLLMILSPEVKKEVSNLQKTASLVKACEVEPPPGLLEDLLNIPGGK